MGQRRKYFKTSKAAMSVSTAFLVVSAIASAAGDASQTNEFVISSDREYYDRGDSVSVYVDFFPDMLGAAGFTADLHYDPEKVKPNIPEENDIFAYEGAYVSVSHKDEGIVRFAGIALDGRNIVSDRRIAELSFTVLDGAEGSLDYWLDVEDLVAYENGDYVNVDLLAPGEDSPYCVKVFEQPVTTTTTTSIATEPPIAETEPVTETEPIWTETATQSTTTSAPTIIEIPDPDTTSAEAYQPEVEEDPDPGVSGSNTLFEYSARPYDDEVWEETEIVQYGFNISDYITDRNDVYDICVALNSTGYVNGGIGMMNNYGEWESQSFESYGGQDEWVFTDLSPDCCWDMAFVQIYYLEYGAKLEIDDLELIPHGSDNSSSPAFDEQTSQPMSPPADNEDRSDDLGYTPTIPVQQENADEEDIGSGDTESGEEAKNDDLSEQDPDTEQNDAKSETLPTEETSEDADTETATPSEGEQASSDTKAEETEEKVSQMAAQADKNSGASNKSNSNPKTGSLSSASPAMAILKAAAALNILYTLFALIYNKSGGRRSTEE